MKPQAIFGIAMSIVLFWAAIYLWMNRKRRAPTPKPFNFPHKKKWARPELTGGFISLDDDVITFIQTEGKCPYCHSQLFEGPRGGASVNLLCGDPDCNSRFNVVDPHQFGLIPMGEFVGPCPEEWIERRQQAALEEGA